MIKSMTGFGRSQFELEGRKYTVEIKSVNHRYKDITVKIPKTISYLEEKVKKEVSLKIERGKVEVTIAFENLSLTGKNMSFNQELANAYIQQLKEIAKNNGLSQDISVVEVAKFPEVLKIENKEVEEFIWQELKSCLGEANEQFLVMRRQEGKKIQEDIETRIKEVSEEIEKISTVSTRLVEEYIVKLKTRIQELLKTEAIPEDRIAQEVVLYADKCSIEEEVTRLQSHIAQFKEVLQEEGAVGKKVDFLLQEMNREINTIGSKAGSLCITNGVIKIKTQLEDIREQIQNIE